MEPSTTPTPEYGHTPINSSMLRNVRLMNPTEGIRIRGIPPLLDTVTVFNSSTSGLSLMDLYFGNLSVSNCNFSNNKQHGVYIYFEKNQLQAIISRTSLNGNGQSGVTFQGAMSGTVVLTENTISNNQNYGLKTQEVKGTLIVANNTFSNNSCTYQASPTVHIPSVYDGDLQILNNEFVNNRNYYARYYYSVYADYVILLGFRNDGHFKIDGNVFRINSGAGVIRLYSHYTNPSRRGEIEHNVFVNNTKPTNLNQNMQTITISSKIPVSLKNNHFDNRDATYEVSMPSYDGTQTDASGCYWGGLSYINVTHRVNSFFNKMTLRIIKLWPYRETADNRTLVLPPDDHWFFSDDIGGEVLNDVTIRARDTPYLVDRSILIRENATLTIEAGVTLLFKSGRGIRVKGALNLQGTADKLIYFNDSSGEQWEGVVTERNSGTGELRFIHMTKPKRVDIYQTNITLDGIAIRGSQEGMSIHSNGIVKVNNCDFSGNNMALRLSSNTANVTISDSTFSENYNGVNVADCGSFTMHGCDFRKHTHKAFGLDRGRSHQWQININISENTFTENRFSIGISLPYSNFTLVRNTFENDTNIGSACASIYVWKGDMTIEENDFRRLLSNALKISEQQRGQHVHLIKDNTMEYINDTPLVINNGDYARTRIEKNVFRSNKAIGKSAAIFMTLYRDQAGNITLNDFKENNGKTIIELHANRPTDNGMIGINSNTFYRNTASLATIVTNTLRCHVHVNMFSNPTTRYDLRVTADGDGLLNATYNWWGVATSDGVAERIWDKSDSPEVGQVVAEPFLVKPEVSCTGVANCSSHGECVRPDTCECHPGWAGSLCSQFSCSQVYDCQGNGDCVGPNTCRCEEGWLPPDCSQPTCYNVNNCSGQGVCVAPDRCHCATQFTGTACEACVSGRWGPSCLPCPLCNHGRCDTQTGRCACDGPNWSGAFCDKCSKAFYGPRCLPLTKILQVAPDRGPDVGETTVHVLGHNFPNSTSYRCRFGRTIVPGTWLSEEDVVCTAPAHTAGSVTLEISSSTGISFTNDQVRFTFYAVCPASACGGKKTPRRGICSMGSCLCISPWTGDDCEILGLPPKITRILDQDVTEGTLFEVRLTTSEGTDPINWDLASGPTGSVLSSRNAVITWTSYASRKPITFVVTAQNAFGKHSVTFRVRVRRSYRAEVDPLPTGPFVRARSVLISGKVVFPWPHSPLENASVPVNIIIKSAIGTRTLKVRTTGSSKVFYKRFYPSSMESGLFQVDARHPTDDGFEIRQQWSVLGIRVRSSTSSLSGYLGQYSVSVDITNVGVDPLSSLTIQKTNVPFSMKVNAHSLMTSCQLSATNCQVVPQLIGGATTSLNVSIEVPNSVRGYFVLDVISSEGATDRVTIHYNFRQMAPKLKHSPDRVSATLLRGKQYTFQVNVTNEGLRSASNVRVELPKDEPLLSVVSFATKEQSPDSDSMKLAPGESALLVLVVAALPGDALGTREGTMVIRSIETSIALPFRFVLASSDKLDLTVRVEDEFTYFAAGKPLLEGATITLKSRLRDVTVSEVTNASGIVVFTGINEDYYSLYSRADKHIGDTRVILATPSDNKVTVFLQRTAVTYRWDVKRVTFEDRYEITLEADFETNVPMPVVTIEPRELDMDVLQRGLVPVINFELTNHGLIRAEDVKFDLPSVGSHPFMHLEMELEKVGSIEANTTIQVPVNVIIDEHKKAQYLATNPGDIAKRSTLSCVAMAIYAAYMYVCDRARYNKLSVPINNALRSNCGGGGGGGGSGGGGYIYYSGGGGPGGPSSSHGGIAVSQSLTCDELINCYKAGKNCFKTVKSGIKCVKSFATIEVPIVGPLNTIWKCYKFIKSVLKCRDSYKKCKGGGGGSRRRKRSVLNQDDLTPELAERLIAATNPYELADIVVGDEAWHEVNAGDWWNIAVQPMFDDNSEMGQLISQKELDTIYEYPLPTGVSQAMADSLIQRINSSLHNWKLGKLEGASIVSYAKYSELQKQILKDTKVAKEAGFDSLSDWYNDGLNTYEQAGKEGDNGVCAKVRIRIQQRLAITRDAFRATLELDNGESHRLTNIRVDVIIRDYVGKEDALHKFSIGQPDVSGMGSVDGDGVLTVGESGKAEWLIIPYSEAAPTHDVQYDIAGTLYYTVGGDNITVPLFPDTITVTPDPRLYLNYFLEKFVKSDDPMTKDVVEPTVPFSLGVLVSNSGYGIARNLRITSGQPEIIENEKGLLIKFEIIAAQLGNKRASPSLTVTFGDIQPNSTKVARWQMTSSLKCVFSNFSATFENVNPLGDPQLSVMESVLFHELLHVVRVDLPEDDGLVDFLVLSEHKLGLVPDRIYQSTDGRHPLNVTSCNITSIRYIGTSQVQVAVHPTASGWVYFRGVYTGDQEQKPTAAVRSDNGRELNVEYNVWMEQLDGDDVYLQILDHFVTAGVSIAYEITFVKGNQHKPQFQQSEYLLNVSEATSPGVELLLVNATDVDPDQHVRYTIEHDADDKFPFAINATTGALRLGHGLDREDTDLYSFDVVATDNGTPERQATTSILVHVLDVNDNAPEFDDIPDTVSVEQSVKPGYVLLTVVATDPDEGQNGVTNVELSSSTSLFVFNASSGELSTAVSLRNETGRHVATFRARDNGSPQKSTNKWLAINVVNDNLFPPLFDTVKYTFEIPESAEGGTNVGQISAVDREGESVEYEMVHQPGVGLPFVVDPRSGNISIYMKLDRELHSNYTFLALATDDGGLPTGPRTSTATVQVTVADVNDNAPVFPSATFNVSVTENCPMATAVLQTTALDTDAGVNGSISNYSLVFSSTEAAFFTLAMVGDQVTVRTSKFIDAESNAEFRFHLVALDGGSPALSSAALVVVKVVDVNDNPPKFDDDSVSISLPRSTVQNTRIYTARATDDDVSEQHSTLTYTLSGGSDSAVEINPDTGDLRLVTSLSGTTVDTLHVTVMASDGLSSAEMQLTIHVVDTNSHAPVFSLSQYYIEVNESTSPGQRLLPVTATDLDSVLLTYSISGGNTDNMFRVEPLTGTLVLLGGLDRETRSTYLLHIEVSDGGVDGANVLTAEATVNVSVLDTNEFSPTFVGGPVYQVIVLEEHNKFNLTVSATDGDGHAIEYSFVSGTQSVFVINADTGVIDMNDTLDREEQSEVRLEIRATDDGEPRRASFAEVFVTISDINDNRPTFAFSEYNLTISEDDAGAKLPITTVHADDLDTGINAAIRYTMSDDAAAHFRIDEKSGSVYVTGQVSASDYVLVIMATDGGQPALSATMRLYVTVLEGTATTPAATTTTPTTSSTTDTTIKSGVSRVCHYAALQSLVVLLFVAFLHD